MSNTKAWKLNPQPRLEPTLQQWWQALSRKADVVTITACVTLQVNEIGQFLYHSSHRQVETSPWQPPGFPSWTDPVSSQTAPQRTWSANKQPTKLPTLKPVLIVCTTLTNSMIVFIFSPRLCPSTTGCSTPLMPSIVPCLLLSCSGWFPPSLLCCLAIFYMVVPFVSLVATQCSV